MIEFNNLQLEAKVKETLGKSFSDIAEKDALKINELDLDVVEISSIIELKPFLNVRNSFISTISLIESPKYRVKCRQDI